MVRDWASCVAAVDRSAAARSRRSWFRWPARFVTQPHRGCAFARRSSERAVEDHVADLSTTVTPVSGAGGVIVRSVGEAGRAAALQSIGQRRCGSCGHAGRFVDLAGSARRAADQRFCSTGRCPVRKWSGPTSLADLAEHLRSPEYLRKQAAKRSTVKWRRTAPWRTETRPLGPSYFCMRAHARG
jgi:hypothetical protein